MGEAARRYMSLQIIGAKLYFWARAATRERCRFINSQAGTIPFLKRKFPSPKDQASSMPMWMRRVWTQARTAWNICSM